MSILDRIVPYTIVAGVCLIAGILLGYLRDASTRVFAVSPSPIEAQVVPADPATLAVDAERSDHADDDANVSPAVSEVVASDSRIAPFVVGPVLAQPKSPVAVQVDSFESVVDDSIETHDVEIPGDPRTDDMVASSTTQSGERVDSGEDSTAGDVESAKTLAAKKDLPVSISALSLMKFQSAITPATCEDGQCPKPGKMLGTSLNWVDTPSDAYREAGEADKLVFLIHVSGNFEIPGFT